ncbi:MAG: FAD-binding oxidoreductase, partial [Rhodobacterales bacterium]|nr:FAD-binding oxidoreductase [Rhodobacterales bacterium]
RHGTLHLAHAPSGLKDLRRRLAQQQARQAPVSLLDAAETARRTGTDRFHGALLDLRAGTVQPLAYAIGLARAAAAAGARMHANTPVSARRHDGTAWYLDTPRGRVTARVLIDATNAYGAVDPRSPDHTPVHFFQAATDPLPADARARILPGGEGCWDTALVMSSLRVDAAGRLVVGAVGRLDGPGGPIHEGWARRFLRHLYPDLAALPFRHAWHGRIAMTGDHLPKVDVLGPMGIRIRGYSGRGIGPGTVFGLAAAQWALSGDAGAFPVAPSSPVAERLTRAKAAYYETGATLTHLVGAR